MVFLVLSLLIALFVFPYKHSLVEVKIQQTVKMEQLG